MTAVSNDQLNAYSVYNSVMPKEGPRAIPLQLDFAQSAQYKIDLSLATMEAKISVIQSIWIDNTQCSDITTVVVNPSGAVTQTIRAPAYSQGWYPVVASNRPVLTVACPQTVNVAVTLFNVPMPSTVYFPNGGLAPDPAPVSSIVALADRVAIGGTPVLVFDGVLRGGGYITNPLDAGQSLYIDPVGAPGTAAPGASGTTTELVPGQTYSLPTNFNGAVMVNATLAQSFTAVAFG